MPLDCKLLTPYWLVDGSIQGNLVDLSLQNLEDNKFPHNASNQNQTIQCHNPQNHNLNLHH